MNIIILAGAYGMDNGRGGVIVVRRGETCTVDDAEAQRLIDAGAAAPADGAAQAAADAPCTCSDTPSEKIDSGAIEGVSEALPENGEPGEPAGGFLDEAMLKSMTVANLNKLAADLEIDVSGCRIKADYVARIAATSVPVPEEDDEEPPDLDAEEPVL